MSELSPAPHDRSLDWRLVARGSLVGLVASVVLAGILTGLRHVVTGFENSGAEAVVQQLALVCYFVGGYYAVGSKYESAGAAGAFAGAGVGALGLAGSLALWAVRHDGAWLTGERGNHPGVVLIGPLIFGAAFGALGGAWARRHRAPA